MIKKLALSALLLLGTTAHADEVTFTIGSHHLVQSNYNKNHEYNEFNPGIGYYFERQNIEVGTYRNSYAGNTFYIGKRYETKYVDIGYGLVHYRNFKFKDETQNMPFVMVSKDFAKHFRIGYAPYINKNKRDRWVFGVFTLQVFFNVN